MPTTCLSVLAALLAAPGLLAQPSGGDFAITREVVAGGGVAMNGEDFAAIATTGQSATGVQSGGPFVLYGGFHVAVAPQPLSDSIFFDGFEGP